MSLLCPSRLILGGLAACILLSSAHAQTTVKDPWARATVVQQKASGAFMQITSAKGGRLVAAESPVAGVVEIHEMAMDGNVMKMRAIPGLDLPAGKPVDLKPGGYHVMLMDLKRALAPGESIPITLVIEGVGGQRERVEVKTAVRPLGVSSAGAPAPAADKGHHGHKH
jgi:copper(I)-binding protein